MAQKLTITLIVLFGLLTLGLSRPTFEDDESFSFDDEEARAYEEEGRDYDDEEARAYEEQEVRSSSDEENRPAYDEEESGAYEEQEVRASSDEENRPAYDEEESGAYEEIRKSEEGPPRLLKFSNFCYGRKDGNYADSSNPRAFYMCDKAGQTWTMNCQAGLVFDQSRNRCEWANESSGGKQTNNEYQPYVPLPAKEIYVPQQPVKEIYIPQQPVKDAYVPKQASSQITGYGR
ncbi:uncharacterized protein LOC116927189 isoform X1 [Daphnia magna]|uniref:uncharacterized protein LOC116927189 isoform X1 n=1 Tax=Daphnia magna TaxID=35525 RepID=UPI001E1BA714|nr:uncharacterized protein LOC116927189 isoform X1 [Daphnia magna]